MPQAPSVGTAYSSMVYHGERPSAKRNSGNGWGIIVAIGVILAAIGVGNAVLQRSRATLSGTYVGAGGFSTLTFDSRGHYSMALAGGNPDYGSYKIDGNHLVLDPTNGEAARQGVGNDPLYQTISSVFQGQISPDRSEIELMGGTYRKQ